MTSYRTGKSRNSKIPPKRYMHEIGTMWQIGVLTGKPCIFLVQNGSFSAFWHYKNKERLLVGSDVKWHISSKCLDVCKKRFSIGMYSINRAFERLWLETQETPEIGQNVHGFQVKNANLPHCACFTRLPPKRTKGGLPKIPLQMPPGAVKNSKIRIFRVFFQQFAGSQAYGQGVEPSRAPQNPRRDPRRGP